MKVGIIGCGAISNLIVNQLQTEKDIKFTHFFDKNIKEAEKIAQKTGGKPCQTYKEMLNEVDIVLEAASQQLLKQIAPEILEHTNLLNMSIGALMDKKLLTQMINTAKKHNTNIYAPSGAILGIDGLKSACIGEIQTIKLTTKKSPKSLGIETKEKKTLFKGKASKAVQDYPKNMNIAATISLATKQDIDVEVIVDPAITQNTHELEVKGTFGQFHLKTQNKPSKENPKTSELAALSAIEKLKNLNQQLHIGN